MVFRQVRMEYSIWFCLMYFVLLTNGIANESYQNRLEPYSYHTPLAYITYVNRSRHLGGDEGISALFKQPNRRFAFFDENIDSRRFSIKKDDDGHLLAQGQNGRWHTSYQSCSR